MFKRSVLPIGDVLQKLLREQGLETPLLQKRLLASWDTVVGSTVAKYTGDKFIKNQTLYVKINNPALKQNLSMIRGRLIRRLNEQAGAMLITEIHLY